MPQAIIAYDRQALVSVEEEWNAALISWRDYPCETLEEEDQWSEALGAAQTKLKEIDDQRKTLALPLDRELKDLNKTFKTYAEPLAEFKSLASKVLSDARARRDAAERAAKLLVAQAAETGDEDATYEALAAVPDKAKVEGTRTTYKWEFEVVDEAAVPAWAKTFDEKKAKAHAEANRLRGASPSIPGVVARYVPVVSTNGRSKG